MRKFLSLILICCTLHALDPEYFNLPILRIAVTGNQIYSAPDILNRAAIKTRRGERLDTAVLQEDLSRIMALGGFRAVDADCQPRGGGLLLFFVVSENPVLREVEFADNVSLPEEQIRDFWQNKTGEQLNFLTLEKDIQHLNRAYQKQGNELSSIQEIELVSDNALRVRIVEPVVGEIVLSGNVYTSDSLILREMALAPGAVFNAKTLAADRVRIFRLGYFSSVLLPEIVPGVNDGEVDIRLQVTEKKKNQLNAGLGVTSREQFAFARFSLINLLDTGEQMQLNMQFGREYRVPAALPKFGYRARYYYPWFLTRDLTWGFTTYLNTSYETIRNPESGVGDILAIRRNGFSTDFSLPLPFGRQYSILLEYKDEFVQEDRPNPEVHYLKRSLALTYIYDSLRYLGETGIALDGDMYRLHFEGGDNIYFLGQRIISMGGVEFLRNELQYLRYIPLTGDNNVVGVSYRSGAYLSSRERNILEGEEYSMGGSSTVRGYADIAPFAVGPKMILLNAEYRYIFNEYWQGVLFYDWGHAFTDPQISVKEFKSGYGFGARLSTPIGPLRFDLGRGELHWIFHFGMGYTF
ncbi:MAG: BamA/TamA family outer membrane protein [Candidatus Margulisbacteria bacterium]|jgi:outer membrane protein insertion porin family|nr:BamA/TamA family outer membrane protein [Candidatus Margulisiibacteriota bacterium]